MPNITVLQCIPTLEGGGAERQLSYMMPELAARGVNVHVALLRGGINLPRIAASDATIHTIPHRGHHDPRIVLDLRSLVREVKPDLIQSWLPQMDVLAGIVALWMRVPLIVSERSSAMAYMPGWKTWLRRLIGARAALIVANSEAGRQYWQHFVPATRIEVVRNTVPLDEISAAPPCERPGLGIPQDAELIVYIGRYSYEKNLPTMVRAIARVLAARPRAAALCFGEGELRANLESMIQQLGVRDRFRINGFTNDALGLLKSADVFVSVSDFEGSPNAVLEAAACHCPLVLSDISAHRELFSADSAWLVSTDSVESIACGIEAVLADRLLAAQKAESAAQIVSRFTGSRITAQYLQIYETLAHTAQNPHPTHP